jgi:serine/threonine-protein kinase
MPLTVGTQLGSHEITGLLGKGGMGEVYRARDTKLKREVAIKILPEEFSRDAARVSRFQREAEVLASLNHPNIAAIYDLQEANDTRFLVLELVEGETLADRIHRGRMPVEEALSIGLRIAEAFEAAHEKGVIHRDLKPANVMITPEGNIKVLDFGLAKALEAAPQQAASNSPTILTAAATNGGVILGTAGYMSPEQARGHAADQRSDIFSFGCVLFEMLTGRQTFQGETVTDLIASVVAREPDFNALPVSLNPKVEDLIGRCLAKNRKERWHAIADVRVELQSVMTDPQGLKVRTTRSGVERKPLWKRTIPIAITAILAGAIGAATVWILRPSHPAPIARFSFALPEGERFTARGLNVIAISPDGANVVYAANDQLYLRAIGEMEARPLPGTAKNPYSPFFSPDGNWVGFYSRADRKFEKVAITGGSTVPICDADYFPWSASWGSNDQIFIAHPTGDIQRVTADGGKPESVIAAKPGELLHGPQLLPGGDALLFTVASGTNRGADIWDKAQIVVQSLKSGTRTPLIEGGSDARYVPSGHIVYALGSTLFAIRFDVKNLQKVGSPIPVLEGVMRSSDLASGAANFSFSNNGSMVYVPGELGFAIEARTIALVDRSGVSKSLNIPPGNYSQPRISPDGKQLALGISDRNDRYISIYDLTGTSQPRRLTFGGHDERPLWTPDGKRIVFTSDRDGEESLFWQRADVSGAAERISKAAPGTVPQPEAWTTDKKTLILNNRIGGRSNGLATLLLGIDQEPKPLIKAPASNSSLSPDGLWLAYHSTETVGEVRVYVSPFPPTGAKQQVTMDAANSPLWSPDGKQLYYLTYPSSQLAVVDVQKTQASLKFGKPTVLPIKGVSTGGPRSYDIMPDGKFVVLIPQSKTEPREAPPPDRINIILSWFEDLRRAGPSIV